MVGTQCDKCTSYVPPNEPICSVCSSVRCRSCGQFTLFGNPKCERCGEPFSSGTERFKSPQPPPLVPASIPMPSPITPLVDQHHQPPPKVPPPSSTIPSKLTATCPRCTFANSFPSDYDDIARCKMCNAVLDLEASASPPVPKPLPEVAPAHHNQPQWTAPPPPLPAAAATSNNSSTRPSVEIVPPPASASPASPTRTPLQRRSDTLHMCYAGSSEYFDDPSSLMNEIESIRATCRASKSSFVDFLNREEMTNLQWGSVNNGGVLKASYPPNSPSEGDSAMTYVGNMFGRAGVGHPAWRLFPEGGISGDDIVQGELGDCWFLSAVGVLAQLAPKLLEKLFLVKEPNPEGVFAVKLCHDGIWKPFIIDGTFPVVHDRYFKYGRCKNNDALWVPLLEKAYAKMHGSYRAIVSGSCDEAFYDLTGMPTERIRVGGQSQQEDEEAFIQMISFQSARCVMGASCGGDELRTSNAKSVSLRPNHAYSVLDVQTCPTTKRRLIKLRNPWGRSDYKSDQPPSDYTGPPPEKGAFWIPFEVFVQTFSDVAVCLTRPYKEGFTAANPRCAPSSHFAPMDPTKGTILISAPRATTLSCMATQPAARRSKTVDKANETNGVYFDVMILLISIDQVTGGQRVVDTSKSACQRVVSLQTLIDPGLYLVLPFSLQQHNMPIQKLVVTVLTESDEVQCMPFSPDLVPAMRISKLFFDWMSRTARKRKENYYCDGIYRVVDVSCGTACFYAFENLDSYPCEVGFDPSKSQSVCFARNSATRGATTIIVPPKHRIIVQAQSVLPHDGGYSYSMAHECKFKQLRGVPPPSGATPSSVDGPFFDPFMP